MSRCRIMICFFFECFFFWDAKKVRPDGLASESLGIRFWGGLCGKWDIRSARLAPRLAQLYNNLSVNYKQPVDGIVKSIARLWLSLSLFLSLSHTHALVHGALRLRHTYSNCSQIIKLFGSKTAGWQVFVQVFHFPHSFCIFFGPLFSLSCHALLTKGYISFFHVFADGDLCYYSC